MNVQYYLNEKEYTHYNNCTLPMLIEFVYEFSYIFIRTFRSEHKLENIVLCQ